MSLPPRELTPIETGRFLPGNRLLCHLDSELVQTLHRAIYVNLGQQERIGIVPRLEDAVGEGE